jgi:hypothetical protein
MGNGTTPFFLVPLDLPLLFLDKPFGNEDVLEAWMVCQPGACLQAIMAAQIVRDDEKVPGRIVCFDLFEQFNIVLGIARSRTAGNLLAIADP